MDKQTCTALLVFTFFKPIISNARIIIDKNAVIIGNQLPYPKGIMLKYEKYLVKRSVGLGANIIATPYGDHQKYCNQHKANRKNFFHHEIPPHFITSILHIILLLQRNIRIM